MMKSSILMACLLAIFFQYSVPAYATAKQQKPNVILVYVDDLGYGDLSCYGATKLHTPNLDKLAKSGIRFTNAHATSSTCTPSRYAMMTGNYPWRRTGTGILPGDAKLIIPTDKPTLPKVFKKQGIKQLSLVSGIWAWAML